MTVQIQPNLSIEEYFEMELHAEIKHEFINGKIRPMGYTSKMRGRIVQNLSRLLGNCLLDSDLEIYTEARMLYVPACKKVYYPDVVMLPIHAKTFTYKGKMEADLHPEVIIEVLSDSTENNDRTKKWQCYRKIKSLKQYILISQDFKNIEVFSRQLNSSKWLFSAHDKDKEEVEISDCQLKLKDIYHRVTFPEGEEISDV